MYYLESEHCILIYKNKTICKNVDCLEIKYVLPIDFNIIVEVCFEEYIFYKISKYLYNIEKIPKIQRRAKKNDCYLIKYSNTRGFGLLWIWFNFRIHFFYTL